LKKQAEEKSKEEKNTAVKTATDKAKLITTQTINDAVASALKPNHVPGDFKLLNFEINNNELNKEEFQYQLNLQLGDPPPMKTRPAPGKLKNRAGPAKKAEAARPYITN
jgi:hypothetical protein